MRNARALVAVLALAAVSAACGGGAPASVEVAVADFTFPAVTVGAGGTVTFTTTDGEPHKVQAEDGSFETDPFGPGQAAEGTLTAPSAAGSYPFICALHPTMTGTLEVQ